MQTVAPPPGVSLISIIGDFGEVDFRGNAEDAGGGLRENVVDQCAHPQCGGGYPVGAPGGVGVGVDGGVQVQFSGVGQDAGQRAAQVVCELGGEVPLLSCLAAAGIG